MRDGKFHLRNPRDTSKRLVRRVIGALIGQRIHAIQLLLGERIHRRILHKHSAAVPLLKQLSPDMILLILLDAAGNCIFLFGLQYIFVGGALLPIKRRFMHIDGVAGASDIRQGSNRLLRIQPPRDLNDLVFSHPVNQQIRAGVEQNGGADRIVPIVVMRKPPEGGLQPADHQRNLRAIGSRIRWQ